MQRHLLDASFSLFRKHSIRLSVLQTTSNDFSSDRHAVCFDRDLIELF